MASGSPFLSLKGGTIVTIFHKPIDIQPINGLFFTLKKEVNSNAGILCKMPDKEGDEEHAEHYHEEW